MRRKRGFGCIGKMIITVCGAFALGILAQNIIGGDVLKDTKNNPTEQDAVLSEDDDWQLMLVNADNPLPENFDVELTSLANGHKIDSRVYPYLQKMFDDARNQGIIPTISSSYRTSEEQQAELNQKTEEFINRGYTPRKALEIAKTWAAVPGTSEHQTGLAVDITSADAEIQSPDIVWQWLSANSYKYGFIRRYPPEKTDITGIGNEPWHFRYVGRAAAEEIYKRGICLEEYVVSAK